MRIQFLSLITAMTLLASIPQVDAEEIYTLNPDEMDRVTAGLSRSSSFNFGFFRAGPLFDGIGIHEKRELITESGNKITATIVVNSRVFRGFVSNFQRSGKFETTISFR